MGSLIPLRWQGEPHPEELVFSGGAPLLALTLEMQEEFGV